MAGMAGRYSSPSSYGVNGRKEWQEGIVVLAPMAGMAGRYSSPSSVNGRKVYGYGGNGRKV